MVVAYHDTQLAITGIVKVIKEVNAVTQELQALEPLLELIVDRVRKEWLGTAKYRISKGYTAEKQAAALLAEARSKEPGPKIVLGRYVDGKLVVPPAPPISNTLDHLGDLLP